MIPRNVRAVPNLDVVRRQNELQDLYLAWPTDDPDDDPAFVAQARAIMGLPPLPSDISLTS